MMMNRRQVMRSALLVAAALKCGPLNSFAFAEDHDLPSSDIDPNKTLFQPMEAATFIAMEKYFPGYRTTPRMQSLLPFTAIVRNGGSKAVKAYKMRWVKHVDGADKTVHCGYFTSRPSSARHSAIATGHSTLVRPGEYAIVTPFFVWSVSKYARHGGDVPLQAMMKWRPGARSFLTSVDDTRTYRVRRDLKISGSSAIGKPSVVTSRFERSINHERLLASTLIAGAQAPKGLYSVTSEQLSQINSVATDLESKVARRYLQSVLSSVKYHGLDTAWANVSKVAAKPPFSLKIRARTRSYDPDTNQRLG